MTDLVGQIRYLIGADDEYPVGQTSRIIECNYDAKAAPQYGTGVKYGNLFYEKYAEASLAMRDHYGPYLHSSDTAKQYDEGQIDPSGAGWNCNLDDQFERAKSQGFFVIELDNPDAYSVDDVLRAYDRAWQVSLSIMAKNPALVEGHNIKLLSHPAVVGCVVEEDAGTCNGMEYLRRAANRSTLPVWFVSFGPRGRAWAHARADVIKTNRYPNMGVTWSSEGEYGNSIDVLLPREIRAT